MLAAPRRTTPPTAVAFTPIRVVSRPLGTAPTSAPAAYAATSAPAADLESAKRSEKRGSSGASTVYSVDSKQTIALTKTRTRRIDR